MIRYRLGLILMLLTLVKTVDAQNEGLFEAPDRGFVTKEPAKTRAHALITGNGIMTALVMGQPHDETIILSQSEFNTGPGPFIPAFDLHVNQEGANIKQYQRSVNYQTGEVIVNWTDDNGSFERKVFVSRVDSVIVVSIKGNAGINAAFDFAPHPVLDNQRESVTNSVEEMKAGAGDGLLTFQCKFKNPDKDGIQGYEGLGRLILKGGKSEVADHKLQISDADEILLLIQILPTKNWSKSLVPEINTRLAAITSSYTELRDKHGAVHSRIFNRSKLSLNSKPADPVYDAGRYNIMSSRDINLPLVIASALSSNMPELMEPYFRYMEEHMPGDAQAAYFFYDYYQYTQDRTFLNDRAYPFMKEAARLHQDSLTPIARQLLTNCIAAAKTLALDAPKVNTWTDVLSKMPPYEVAADGPLPESFDNVGDLFNTDISGGLPAVILEKLVYSEQDLIKLLPALPNAWTKGRLEGALLRGNISLKSLEWDNKQVKLTLNTKVRRAQTLVFPADVERLLINGFSISVNRIKDRKFLLNLAQARDINLEITWK